MIPLNPKDIRLQDVYSRQCQKEILATTAMYGPWTPKGEFDWKSYDRLVQRCLVSGSVPATNVDTTWAIYNDWPLTKKLIWRTAELAQQHGSPIGPDRPLLVAGLNTNATELTAAQIARALQQQMTEIDIGLRQRGFNGRIRYMPVPDKRLYQAPGDLKRQVYQEIGKVVGDFTDYGFVFFELDIGIPGFGSDFTLQELADILVGTPQIQEYKSALITQKVHMNCVYDFCDDMARIQLVEQIAPERIQFSTGNDWFIALARYGKNVKNYGYLLGASQMSVELFQIWREFVRQGKSCSLALEQDIQAAAKDFWTPGNVGIYRHYMAIFLAMTGQISHSCAHPKCEARYLVQPEDYFIPLKHAVRLGLLDRADAHSAARTIIPGCSDWSEQEMQRRLEWIG